MTVAFGTSTPTSMTVVATSTSRRPSRNWCMVASLSAEPRRPCSRPRRRPSSSPAASSANVSSADRTSSLSDSSMSGRDDVRLAPGGHLAAHRGPHGGLVVLGAGPGGDDLLAARRPRADHGDVEVAVDRHRRRARDRRGGHDQDVGHRAAARLVAQRRPLLDAEAVLLVDHDRAERGEVDALLDEGVGADGDVDLAGGQPGEDPPAVGRTHLVGQQLDPDRPGAEQRRARVGHLDVGQQGPDAEGVLLGEDLGRRHEGALVPALHRGEQRPHGDDRLAAADVALQQPVHRVRGRQVLPDLGDRPPAGRR